LIEPRTLLKAAESGVVALFGLKDAVETPEEDRALEIAEPRSWMTGSVFASALPKALMSAIVSLSVVGTLVAPLLAIPEGARELVTEAVTVTAQLAFLEPSTVLTVMVAVPAATGVTSPAELTVATEAASLDQVTLLFEALDGASVATSVLVPPPTSRLKVVLFRDTPVTATWALTVTWQLELMPPSAVVTVTVVEPTETGLTTPPELTVATEGALLDQPRPWFVALLGETVAVRVAGVPPTDKLRVFGLRLTPVTDTVAKVAGVQPRNATRQIKAMSGNQTFFMHIPPLEPRLRGLHF